MKKEDLEQYCLIEIEINDLTEEIKLLRAEAAKRKWPDGQPHGNYTADRTGDTAAETVKLCADLSQLRGELIRCRRKIEEAIRRLPPLDRQIIRLRYVQGLRWEEIAEKMGYSTRHMGRLHDAALDKLDASRKARCL